MIFNKEKFNVIEIQSVFKIILVESFIRKNPMFSILEDMFGWGNGYICLPEWHPWFNVEYDEIDVDIHGGLTFSSYDEDEDLWVIGFDTGHSHSASYDYNKVLEETKKLEYQCLNAEGVKEKIRLVKIKKLLNG